MSIVMKFMTILGMGILLFLSFTSINRSPLVSDTKETLYFIDTALPKKDALKKLAYSDSNALHLFSHGRPGALFLEGKWLSGAELVIWLQDYLRGAESLYIYGCNFAKGIPGKRMVERLERELGVSIAASDDITGRRGDWDLEVGQASHRVPDLGMDYPFDLQDTDGDGVPDAQDLDDDNDGILDVDENGQTRLVFRYTGNDQFFTVPADVTELQVKAWGAGGGGSNYMARYGTGGAGGFVSGSITVVPGTYYTLVVGQGGNSDNNPATGPIYGFGGERTDHYKGSFGGGLSGIFTGMAPVLATSRSRAVMIAGGGGAGERSTFSVASGGQGGDPIFGGGTGTMQGGNSPVEYGGGGGGGYDGGVSGRSRLTSDATTTVHGEGGTNFLAPYVVDPISTSTADLAALPDPFAVSENDPPYTLDPVYEFGIGIGTSISGTRGGHGLIVIEYIREVDTDGDGTPDYQDLDSDGDGCSDANEAYGDSTADGGDTMEYGMGIPTLGNGGVNANGLVIAAGIDASGATYTNNIATTAGGNQIFRQGMIVNVGTDPTDAVVNLGDDAVFTGSATAVTLATIPPTTTTTDLLFTWQVSTDNGNTFTSIPGENGMVPSGSTVTLTVNNVTAVQEGNQYRLIFFNQANVCYEASVPATLHLATTGPSMSLSKMVVLNDLNSDGIPQAGETLTYNFNIVNTRNVVLNNLEIEDPMLGGTICTVSTLAVGGIYSSCSVPYILSQQNLDVGSVSNQAMVRGTAPDGTIVQDLSDDPADITDIDTESDGEPDDPTEILLTASPQIGLVKTGAFQDMDGDGCSNLGEPIRYRFAVTNLGNVTLHTVVLRDAMLGGAISGPISGDTNGNARLDTNEIWVYEIDYPIVQADIDRGGVDNQATVEATAPDGTRISDRSGTQVDNDVGTRVDLCQNHWMSLQKTGYFEDVNGDGLPQSGESIRYTFQLTNIGNTTLQAPLLSDPLLGGAVCQWSELPVGTTVTCEGMYEILDSDILNGIVTNQAVVTAQGPDGTMPLKELSDDPNDPTDQDVDGDGDPDDPTEVILVASPGIALVMSGTFLDANGDACANPGEAIEYVLRVANMGNVPLGNIEVEDTLSGMFMAASHQGDVNGNEILDVDEIWEYRIVFPIDQIDIDLGWLENQAIVQGNAPDGSIVEDISGADQSSDGITRTVLCQRNMFALEKTGTFEDDNRDGLAQPGESIRYAFEVVNTGNTTLEMIVLDDPLLGGTVCERPILLAGERMVCEATYMILADDVARGSVTNQARVRSIAPDGTVVEDISDDPMDFRDVDIDDDGDPDDPTVVELLEELEGELEIFNGITPNDDGLNDYFEIRGIAKFPENQVSIFNRWGVLVWETEGYDEHNNVFRGFSNGRATINQSDKLPPGTYFYVIRINSEQLVQGKRAFSGFLYIDP